MNDLKLVVAWTEEFREAPEFVAMQEWVRTQAEQVWDHVESVEEKEISAHHGALLIVADRCLIGRKSLASMRRALEDGAPAVVPRRLASSGLPGLEAVRTLRAIERAEIQVLGGEAGEAAEPPPWAAVLVSSRDSVRISEKSARSIMSGNGVSEGVVTTGLCHEFIDYYGEAREDILPFLGEDCENVLEIGCGRGATGVLLQERLGCRVTGIELNPVVARAAGENLHRVIVGDVLEVDPGEAFDAVVACELFEHLTEQAVFLNRLRRWLRPGGRAVLSVPNVGHHSVVGDLLAGRWDYLPVGLLCFTHFRFFTRRTLEDWITAAGLHDFDIIPQSTEAPDWLEDLPASIRVDTESLTTQGFYVVIRVP